MVSSYVGSVTQQLSPRQLHSYPSWPLMAPPQGQLVSERGNSCEYEVPLPYSAAQPAWDLTLEPIWKITAALKGGRQDSCAAPTATSTPASAAAPTSAPLSPLAQRAANAAVRAAAGWLSPGQWRSAQAGGSAAGHGSSPGKAGPQPRSSAAASASTAAAQPQVSEDGLVAFRPRRWVVGAASDLESSITALADALGALQSGGYSQCEAFPSPSDLHQPSRPMEANAPRWQAPQLQPQIPYLSTAAFVSADEWEDGEGSVDGELGRSGDVGEEPSLLLQRSCSSEFFSACSGSLSTSEERSSSEASPTQLSPLQHAPLSPLPASTIRQNLLAHFPEAIASKAELPPAEDEPPCAHQASHPSTSQVPLLSPFAMAAARGASDRPSLQTPFAVACTASPFEAPSPRDMHLSPAEERLVPTPSLGSCGGPANDSAEGESPREHAERERASRMLACLWATTEKAPWAEAPQPAQPLEARQPEGGKREQHPQRPAAPPPSCAAQHKSGGATGKRLFGIVGDGQSEWQPLVRESNQVMEMAGLDTDWLLHDLLVYADAVYA